MATYSPFHVSVTSISGALFDGAAQYIIVPSVEGAATILAHHEPFIALLKKGTITILDGAGKSVELGIESGVLEVSNNRAIVIL